MSDFSDIRYELELIESLDSAHETTPPGGIRHGDHGDMKDVHEHIIVGGHGSIFEFHKNGIWEIHHAQDGDEFQAQIDPNKKTPNPKWVATMVGLAKDRVSKGNTVKIIGTTIPAEGKRHSMFDTYNTIANRIAKKEGFYVSSPHHYYEPSLKAHVASINLSQRWPSKEFPGEVQDKVMESRTEENNYVGLTYNEAIRKIFTKLD
jgi:hypothetical protein